MTTTTANSHNNIKDVLKIITIFIGVYLFYAFVKHKYPFEFTAELMFFSKPLSFWYTALYSTLVLIFGIKVIKKYNSDKKQTEAQRKYQRIRVETLVMVQLTFLFLIPEFLVPIIHKLVHLDPGAAWYSYGLVLSWPLFQQPMLSDQIPFYRWWAIILAFIVMPLYVHWNGKRFCSWICGCGALAETVGDIWRTKAPKGKMFDNLKGLGYVVFIFAILILIDSIQSFYRVITTSTLLSWYSLYVDLALASILGIASYPIWGTRIWCSYFCPLEKYMGILSKLFGKIQITADKGCIECGLCNKYCETAVDVMSFAVKQESFDSGNTACIECGLCIYYCPVNILEFDHNRKPLLLKGN